ncbi:MAG TPA: Gp138 family membrane-puncturing spike protein [Polyangia bacterium]|jgi:hypothetical protein|nr:Gp138 family membrane-puncturing spike protein [Polyangia bacterium]
MEMVLQSLRVALPGIVQSFDPGPPATVKVLVATNELSTWNHGQGNQIAIATESKQLPILCDVPVQLWGGGSWTVTFPIQPGDECMLVFADTPLDVWFQNGDLDNRQIDQRRHTLSDGVAFVGIRSAPRGLENYSRTSTQIRNDESTVVIDLAPEGITITAPAVTVNATGAVTVNANEVDVNAETVTVDAEAVTIGAATKIDGKQFLLHKHAGVQTGSGSTGSVV